jgi:hypothetical protein
MLKEHALLVLFDILCRYEAGELPKATLAHGGTLQVGASLGQLSPEMTGVFVAFDREIDRMVGEDNASGTVN